MRKDRISLLILAAEIVGIVWLHSRKAVSEKKPEKNDIVQTKLLQKPGILLHSRFIISAVK
jgi:hypothetical protein